MDMFLSKPSLLVPLHYVICKISNLQTTFAGWLFLEHTCHDDSLHQESEYPLIHGWIRIIFHQSCQDLEWILPYLQFLALVSLLHVSPMVTFIRDLTKPSFSPPNSPVNCFSIVHGNICCVFFCCKFWSNVLISFWYILGQIPILHCKPHSSPHESQHSWHLLGLEELSC